MEIILKLAAAIASAITAGINMFRTAKPGQGSVIVEISSYSLNNVRGDTTVLFSVKNLTSEQVILTDIRTKRRKIAIRYGLCHDQAPDLDSYVRSIIKSRAETAGTTRFFPPRISPQSATYGFVALSGTNESADLIFAIQPVGHRRSTKIKHRATIAPPLAAIEIVAAD